MYFITRGKTGSVEGTGAAIFVECGFTPRYVKLVNVDGDATLEWMTDMGAGKGFRIASVSDGGFAVGGEIISSGGITVAATHETNMGFSIGADTAINVDGETIIWMALGE